MAEFTTKLHEVLAAYTLPGASSAYFAKVFKGEPNALTPVAGKPLARWRVLRSQAAPEGPRVLTGSRQIAVVFGIFAYWAPSASETKQRSDEDDIATVLVDLPNKFISPTITAKDYTIAGKALAVLTVEDTQLVDRSIPLPGSETVQTDQRILSFELHARILEAS